ncbi:hypothetical protein BD408DRAFT_418834 [Parasitella parasitica]|nr:hypothetical protein BD408DRAFT_418834 [Parasitella parasitica]
MLKFLDNKETRIIGLFPLGMIFISTSLKTRYKIYTPTTYMVRETKVRSIFKINTN